MISLSSPVVMAGALSPHDTRPLFDPLFLAPLSLLALLLIAIGVWGLGVLHRRFQSRELRDLHDRARLMELELRDLTAAQSARQNSLSQLRAAADASPVAELWWDAADQCVFANAASRTLLGMDPMPSQTDLARALGLDLFYPGKPSTFSIQEQCSTAAHPRLPALPPEGIRCVRDSFSADTGLLWRWRLYPKLPAQFCPELLALTRADMDTTFLHIHPDGTLADWPPSLTRWIGYTSEDALGRPLSLLWNADETGDDLLRQFLAGARAMGRCERTVRSQHKDGSRVWLRVVVLSVNPGEDFVAMIRDMSEQHWMDEQMQLRDSAIACAADGIVIADACLTDRPIIFVNTAFEQITGYVASDVIGTNLRILHRGDDTQPALDTLRRSLRDGEPCRVVLRNYRKDGSTFCNEIRLSPVVGDDRQITHWVAILSDITRRMEAEDGLRRFAVELESRVAQRTTELCRANADLAASSRLKDEFLANVSHELRTPLNAILGLAEALAEESFGPIAPPQLKALTTLHNSGRHLLSLINDLLDLSKIESGHLELQITHVSIPSLCEHCIALLAADAKSKAVHLEFLVPAGFDPILGDERRLQQILLNLLGNAIKFTPPGGTVELACSMDAARDAVLMRVRDTGIGIPTHQLSKLFQPFVQLESSLDRHYAGSGLGLALVRRLVGLHGGSVTIDSAPDVGTELHIALPRRLITPADEHTERARLHNRYQASGNHTPPFLIVFDNDLAGITSISGYLAAMGFSVALADHDADATRLAAEHAPDLILIVTNTSASASLDQISRLREHPALSAIPIVVLASLILPGDREKVFEAGAAAYATKPQSLKSLAQLVETYKISRKSA